MSLSSYRMHRIYLAATMNYGLGSDDPKAIYQHAAEWGEFLNWETTPVFTDEEAGPLVAKVYS